jgi:hypothetical protein
MVGAAGGLGGAGNLDIYKARFGDILTAAVSIDGTLGEAAVGVYLKA